MLKRSVSKITFVEGVVILVVAVVLGLILLSLLASLATVSRGPRRSCANNLKHMGLVFKMYANEWEGASPPMAPYRGVWMIDLPRVYPEYMTHPPLLVCCDRPDHQIRQDEMSAVLGSDHTDWEKATRMAADSYTYANWVIRDDSDVDTLAKKYAGLPEGDYDHDIVTDQHTFYRLRDGVERLLAAEPAETAALAATASTIPVMFDTVRRARSYHKPPGSNVLYLDGHVEFLNYGEQFPATGVVADAFPPPGL